MTAPSLGLTSYSEQLAGFAGMIADLRDGGVIVSARSSEASTEIAFGTAVIRDTDALTPSTSVANVKYPTATGFRCYGLVVHAHDYENGPNGNLGITGVKPDGHLSLMRRGMMYVNVEDAATEGNAAFVRHTANGAGKTPGNLRSDADTNKADKVQGVTFRGTTTTAGDLVLVEVDLMAYDAVKQ
jgi:hypothetical protein